MIKVRVTDAANFNLNALEKHNSEDIVEIYTKDEALLLSNGEVSIKRLVEDDYVVGFVKKETYTDKHKTFTQIYDDECEIVEEENKSMIKDSGNRTEFKSGAVRDCAEGKGRCDLLPLDVISIIISDGVIGSLHEYQKTEDTMRLYDAIEEFLKHDKCPFKSKYEAILELSIHFEEGAKKYDERNWEKGIDEYRFIDSAVRHYLKWLDGRTDERHDRAFLWNIVCLIWTHYHVVFDNEDKEEQ